MPDVLRIKRRVAGGAAGGPTSLMSSEICFNEQDRTLYYGMNNAGGVTTNIIPIAGTGAFLPLSGGTVSGGLTVTGFTTLAGVGFGSLVAPGGVNDLSKHIGLYSNSYGFSVTSSRLNIVSSVNSSQVHVINGVDLVTINATVGLSVAGNLSANAATLTSASVNGALTVTGTPTLATSTNTIGLGGGTSPVDINLLNTGSNVRFNLASATSVFSFNFGGGAGFRVSSGDSAVPANYLWLNASAAGSGYVTLASAGSDANIDLRLTTVGTGVVRVFNPLYMDTSTAVGVLAPRTSIGIGTDAAGMGAAVAAGTLMARMISVHGTGVGWNIYQPDINIGSFSYRETLPGGWSVRMDATTGVLNFWSAPSGTANTAATLTLRQVFNLDGSVTLGHDPVGAMDAVTLQYLNANSMTLATADARFVNVTGDTMTGNLTAGTNYAAQSGAAAGLFTNANYALGLVPRAGPGSYNGLVQSDDAILLASTGTVGTGALTLTTSANTTLGVRISGPQNLVDIRAPTISLISGANSVSVTATGTAFNNGVTIGNQTAPGGVTDLSKHIALYSTTYGFNITSGRMNLVSHGTVTSVIDGVDMASVSSSGLTVTSLVQINGAASAAASFTLNNGGGASGNNDIKAYNAGSIRWIMRIGSSGNESGGATGNTGSEFSLYSYRNDGQLLGQPFYITRTPAGGDTTINGFGYVINDPVAQTGIVNIRYAQANFLRLVGGTMSGGISFGALTDASVTDMSKHIVLHTNGYGFGVTSNARLNYNAEASGTHALVVGGSDRLTINASNTTVNTNLIAVGTLDVRSWIRVALNTNAPPPVDTAGYISWNRSQGGGEVNFYNAFSGAGGDAFDWRWVTGAGTETRLASLHTSGSLALLTGTGVRYWGVASGGNAIAFAWTGSAVRQFIDGAGAGDLATQAWVTSNASGMTVVANIAALRALTTGVTAAYVQGYYAAGDGGGGAYVLGTSGTDNGGSIIRATNGNTYYLQTYGQPVSVRQFGAYGDDSHDDTTAVQAALNAALDVLVPAGPGGAAATYYIFGQLNTRVGHTIRGAGTGSSTLKQYAQGTWTISCVASSTTLGNILIADLTIRAGQPNVRGIQSVLYSDVTIQNVQFVGCANMAVHIDRGYFILLDNCVSVPSSAGNWKAGGFEAVSSDSGNYCFYPTLRDCRVHTVEYESGSAVGASGPCVNFNRVIGGLIENFVGERLNLPTANSVVGIQIAGDCQGVKIIGGVTFGASYGVVAFPDGGSAAGPGYIVIENHDVDVFYVAGISVNGTSVKVCADITIRDCIITAPQSGAICITVSQTLRLIIDGNTIDQYQTAGVGDGVQLSATNMVLVTRNIMTNLHTAFGMVPSCVNTQFTGNILMSNTTNIVGDMSASNTGTNMIKDNTGAYNWNLPYTTPPVPASGVYVQNTTGLDVMVYCYGGNGCTIGVNNKNTGILFAPSGGEPKGGSCFLPANGTIGINYQTAPTWSWIPV